MFQGFQGFQKFRRFEGFEEFEGFQRFQKFQGFQGLKCLKSLKSLKCLKSFKCFRGFRSFRSFRGFRGFKGFKCFSGSRGSNFSRSLQGGTACPDFSGTKQLISSKSIMSIRAERRHPAPHLPVSLSQSPLLPVSFALRHDNFQNNITPPKKHSASQNASSRPIRRNLFRRRPYEYGLRGRYGIRLHPRRGRVYLRKAGNLRGILPG